MFEKLFSPITIRGMELKNRVMLPAMGTKFAGKASYVTDQLIDYHVARVKGGCGLNMVEVCSVHTPSAPRGFLSISEDEYVPGLKKLTDAIHENGGKAGIQLWQGSIAVSMDPKAQVLVVSDMNFGPYTIKAITKEQIQEVIACYGKAAARAVEAGYDCLEFHLAHNYLPHSFLSAGFNHREDEYGGSFENRCRFPLEVIDELRRNMPEGMPLFIRIDAQDDMLENGLTIEEVIRFCKIAKEHGVDVLDVSRGNIITAASMYEVPPIDVPNGFNIENAARIRKETGMLTVGVGRINTAELAEEILSQDKSGYGSTGERAQLAESGKFCKQSQSGKKWMRSYTVWAVIKGCYDGFCDVANRPHITCMRNPAIGHEAEYDLNKAEASKKYG